MKYRGRTEILGNILDAANGGATKTKIMYKAFLSYGQLKGYLFILVENNLIKSRNKHLDEKISKRIAEIVWSDIKTEDIRDSLQIAKLTYSIEDVEDIAHS